MDGTIPRGALPKALARIRELSQNTNSGVANVFHAGDGNLHPLILYDANKPGEMARAEAFGADILRCCVELGGVLTGEHGVGIEKRDLMRRDVQRDRSQPAAAAEMRLRRRRACSIPERCFRPCTAAPNSAASTCMVANRLFRICRGSEPVLASASRPRKKLTGAAAPLRLFQSFAAQTARSAE